jgi:hypothetical protein
VISTIFGDLTFNDKAGLQDWLTAHDASHRTERKAIINLGTVLSGWPLIEPGRDAPLPSQEWFGRHMLMHVALKTFFTPDDSVSSLPLERQWNTEQAFNEWHQMHDQIHKQIDAALGVQ